MTPNLTEAQFNALAKQGYNRIPLMCAMLADMDTPLSAYMKLCDASYSYLFESVQGGEKWGRYSIIGLPTGTMIRVNGNSVEWIERGDTTAIKQCDDPLAEIDRLRRRYNVPDIDGMPRFSGGLVGYFGYDTIAYIEPRLNNPDKDDPLGTPDILLMVSEEVVVFDKLCGKLFIIVHADLTRDQAYADGLRRLDAIKDKLTNTAVKPYGEPLDRTVAEKDFKSGFTREGFERAVDRIKHYIREGDAMQVVLSQRLSIPFDVPAIDFYRALRCLNPSPYMYYLDLDDFQVAGSSPEMLVRLEDDTVTLRPIAGTRPRGVTEGEDLMREQELLADPKELAEHLMLIDLSRNDTGRVAETGTVRLTDKMIIERYSHVMHMVSNVTGRLRNGMTALDVLYATFPAGTVSGAPKIRAMEIIDELEPVKRGVYSGAVGYLDWSGNMDTAIAIRTAVIRDNTLYVQAGAGIVADSIPANEWEETMNKGRAIFSAASMAGGGLTQFDG